MIARRPAPSRCLRISGASAPSSRRTGGPARLFGWFPHTAVPLTVPFTTGPRAFLDAYRNGSFQYLLIAADRV